MYCKERCPYQGRQPQYTPLNRGILQDPCTSVSPLVKCLLPDPISWQRMLTRTGMHQSSGTCLWLEGLFCNAVSRQPQITACRTAAICSFDANGTRQPLC